MRPFLRSSDLLYSFHHWTHGTTDSAERHLGRGDSIVAKFSIKRSFDFFVFFFFSGQGNISNDERDGTNSADSQLFYRYYEPYFVEFKESDNSLIRLSSENNLESHFLAYPHSFLLRLQGLRPFVLISFNYCNQ